MAVRLSDKTQWLFDLVSALNGPTGGAERNRAVKTQILQMCFAHNKQLNTLQELNALRLYSSGGSEKLLQVFACMGLSYSGSWARKCLSRLIQASKNARVTDELAKHSWLGGVDNCEWMMWWRQLQGSLAGRRRLDDDARARLKIQETRDAAVPPATALSHCKKCGTGCKTGRCICVTCLQPCDKNTCGCVGCENPITKLALDARHAKTSTGVLIDDLDMFWSHKTMADIEHVKEWQILNT